VSKKRASQRAPHIESQIGPDGSMSFPASAEGLQIELGKLPTPELSGFADACLVADRGLVVDVRFMDSAVHQVVARFVVPKGDLFDTFWKNVEEFYTSTKNLLAERHVPVIPVQEKPPEPRSPNALPAHIFRIGRLGMEAELEAYYLSIGSAGRAAANPKNARITIYPTNRVYLSVPVLFGLLEYLRGIRGSTS
jgi:hypothetical protein